MATPPSTLQPGVLGRAARMRRLRVYPTPRRAFQATTSPFEQWLGAGTTDLATSTTGCFANSGSTQTYTTTVGIDPPANSRLVAVCRAGRGGHTAAYSWSFTASGGLGAMTVAWTGAEYPAVGNSFARQMAIAYVDVGATPPTGVTVTVDAWATTDVGVYGVAVFCVPAGTFNVGSWLAQTPAETYSNPDSTSATVTLAAASTGRTYAVSFAEDSLGATTWGAPEAGWDWLAREVASYYNSDVRLDATGDSNGSTTFYWTPGLNNTATSVIFEVAPPSGGPTPINLAGALTSAGAVTRSTAQPRAGTITSAGALTKQARRAIPLGGASLPPGGALARQTGKATTGSITAAGALSTIRAILRTFTAAVTPAGALARSTATTKTGTATAAGTMVKTTGKPLAGTVTSSATLSTIRAILRAFAGTVSSAGALTRQPRKPVAGTVASSATVTRSTLKLLAGSTTPTGALTRAKVALIALAGALSSAGALTRRPGKALASSTTPAGVLARQPRKALAATITSAGTVTRARLAVIALAGSVAATGIVTKQTRRALAGTLAAASALARQARLRFTGAATSSGTATATGGGAEPWTWFLQRGGTLHQASAKLDGQATTTDVT